MKVFKTTSLNHLRNADSALAYWI